jgi:uncharacterized protein DUF6629
VCVSPEADFLAAGALLPVGAATLHAARHRGELLLASLPALFALHQLVEGFVWLGLRDDVSAGVQAAAIRAYLGFAQVALPVLVPLAVLLAEPERARRRWLVPFLALGAVVGVRLGAVIATHPAGARALHHLIAYSTDVHFGYVTATAYVVATCGPPLLSSRPGLRLFGAANLAGLAVATLVRYSAVTSVWCLYAAFVSALILVHLRREAPGRAPAPAARPSAS